MARAAYRKAGEHTGLWLLLGLAGVASMLGTLFLLSRTEFGRQHEVWTFVISVVPMLSSFLFAAWLLNRLKRRRIGAIAAHFAPAGVPVAQKPTLPEQEQFAAPLAHLLIPTLGLVHGAAGIQWFGTLGKGATTLRLFEHEFVTGSGRTTNIHYHTVAAWPAGHPEIGDGALATAPWFFMRQTPWLARRAVRDRELKQPEFADLESVWSLLGDAGTGARFLTPSVRAQLAQSPRGEGWSLGAGWVCCFVNGALAAEELDRFLAHARGVLAAGRR